MPDPEAPAAAKERARHLACRMPFVHFPSSTKFVEWSRWGALCPKSQLGESAPEDDVFAQLRSSHVFAYAGPCCFAEAGDNGDIAAYFDPGLDQRVPGHVSPFDSGSLEDPHPRLQKWANEPVAERWSFLQKNTWPLTGWREHFEDWLTHCYENPDRYIDCQADRYAAGLPDRTRPPELRAHNGVTGRNLTSPCADRRAWTWEARFAGKLPFSEIRALHVPFDRLQRAAEARSAGRFGGPSGSVGPELVPLPPGVAASAEALYLHSRDAIEALL